MKTLITAAILAVSSTVAMANDMDPAAAAFMAENGISFDSQGHAVFASGLGVEDAVMGGRFELPEYLDQNFVEVQIPTMPPEFADALSKVEVQAIYGAPTGAPVDAPIFETVVPADFDVSTTGFEFQPGMSTTGFEMMSPTGAPAVDPVTGAPVM